MSDVTIKINDASAPGVLSIGSQVRIFSLGNGMFILATTRELREQLDAMYEDELSAKPREVLGASTFLMVHSDDGKLGEFVPLGKSEDLKALIRQMVVDVITDTWT